MMTERYGEKAEPMFALYRNRYPDKSPYLIQAQIATDAGGRRNAILQGRTQIGAWAKPATCTYGITQAPPSAENSAPSMEQMFPRRSTTTATAWAEPVRPRKKRCGSASPQLGSRSQDRRTEQSQDSHWPAYDAGKRATMIFDNNTHVENDPRGEIRSFWEDMPQPTSPLG